MQFGDHVEEADGFRADGGSVAQPGVGPHQFAVEKQVAPEPPAADQGSGAEEDKGAHYEFPNHEFTIPEPTNCVEEKSQGDDGGEGDAAEFRERRQAKRHAGQR